MDFLAGCLVGILIWVVVGEVLVGLFFPDEAGEIP